MNAPRWGALDRRAFLKNTAGAGAGLLLATLGGAERLLAQLGERPVRRRLRPGDYESELALDAYAEAVQRMRALPRNDPRSWRAQAAIHGSAVGGFNFCQHRTDHFFSWHRAYLSYFERICRELLGEPQFALPYWNWNQNPRLHPAFTDQDSPLFHQRARRSLSGEPGISNRTLDTILSDPNFFTFGSQLEGTPHNTVHVALGGDMRTAGSAVDPIFWLHHGMIDYCWSIWNLELGNDNPGDDEWSSTGWDHFVDEQGETARIEAGEAALLPLNSYQYELSRIGTPSSSRSSGLSGSQRNLGELRQLEQRVRKGARVTFDVRQRVRLAEGAALRLARPFSRQAALTGSELRGITEGNTAPERVFASIHYAPNLPENDFFVRVFLGLPGANASTSIDDVHYAGSFAFFGTPASGSSDHRHRTDFLVNVTDTLRRLQRGGELREGSSLSVQLVAVPADPTGFVRPDTELTLEGIDLVVSPLGISAR